MIATIASRLGRESKVADDRPGNSYAGVDAYVPW